VAEFALDNRALIEARVQIPQTGLARAWTEIDGETAISGLVSLELAGGTAFQGAVISGGVSDTRVLANWVQGQGKLASTRISGQHFFEPTPRDIIENIITLAGEVLNPEMPPICDKPLARWMRFAETADAALSAIVGYLGLAWWADLDGKIRVGTPDYPEVRPDIDVFPLDSPEWKRLDFASDEYTVLPRSTVVTEYGNYRVTEVRYYLHNNKLRGTFYYA